MVFASRKICICNNAFISLWSSDSNILSFSSKLHQLPYSHDIKSATSYHRLVFGVEGLLHVCAGFYYSDRCASNK